MAVITEPSVCKSQLYILSSDQFKIVLAGGDGDIILSSINPSIHFFQDTDRFGSDCMWWWWWFKWNIISRGLTCCKNPVEDELWL